MLRIQSWLQREVPLPMPRDWGVNYIFGKAYPDLERGDIQEALRYAAEAVRERELPLVAG
jgi:hypothetical protein